MKQEVRVWDPLVRIFHWGLVATFVIAYLTGDEENSLHIYSGYTVLGLITFRVIWGIIGTRHARFSDFAFSPTTVLRYLASLATTHPKHYIGHNPAGGWMMIAMLATLFVVSISGLKVYALEEGLGPLAGEPVEMTLVRTAHADDDEYEHRGRYEREDNDDHDEYEGDENGDTEEFWEEIHEASSNFMVFLIVLHIAGVLVSSRLHRENLVKAMITGKKKEHPEV